MNELLIFYNNKIIKPKIPLLIDNTIETIKNKLFAESIEFYPPFITVFAIDNDKKKEIHLTNEHTPLKELNINIKNNTLKIMHYKDLLNEIKNFPEFFKDNSCDTKCINKISKQVYSLFNKKGYKLNPSTLSIIVADYVQSKYNINLAPQFKSELEFINQRFINNKKQFNKKGSILNIKMLHVYKTKLNIPFIFDNIELSENIPIVVDMLNPEKPKLKYYKPIKSNKSIMKLINKSLVSNNSLKKSKDLKLLFLILPNLYGVADIQTNGTITIKVEPNNNELFQDNIEIILEQFNNHFISQLSGTIPLLSIKNINFSKINHQQLFFKEVNLASLSRHIQFNKPISKEGIILQNSIREKSNNNSLYLHYTQNKHVININIKTFMNESFEINILNATSFQQIHNINDFILSLVNNLEENISSTSSDSSGVFSTKSTEEQKEVKRKIKKDNKLNILKSAGIKVNSLICQKPRQLTIDNKNKLQPLKARKKGLPDSYELKIKNNRLLCLPDNIKSQHIYPGFTTNKDIPCCFTTDQRKKDVFIKNTNPDIISKTVQPSNLKITLPDNTTTFVIKSQNNFYYLDSNLELVKIKNNDIISKIKSQSNIWLPKVPLSRLINVPSINDCNEPPDLKNDIKCNNPNKPHFHYNNKGYPCCFSEPKKAKATPQKESFLNILLNNHIIKTDKTLEVNRIGKIPDNLNLIFKDAVNNKDTIYKLGILQNNHALFNIVETILNEEYNYQIDFIKNDIVSKLTIPIFKSINNGLLARNTTYQDFKNILLSTISININVAQDLLSKIYNLNIVIFNTINNTFKCNAIINDNYPYIFVLQNEDILEPVIVINSQQKKLHLSYTNKNTPKFHSQLIKLFNTLCPTKKEPIINLNNLYKLYPNIKQIINNINSVNYVLMENFIFPIKPSGPLINIQNSDMILFTAKQQYNNLTKFINQLPIFNYATIESQIINNDNQTIALKTSSNLFIPVLPSEPISFIETDNITYFENIDEILLMAKNEPDVRITNTIRRNYKQELYQRILFEVARFLNKNNETKDKITNIINDKLSRSKKIKQLEPIVQKLIDKLIHFSTSKKIIEKLQVKRYTCFTESKDTCNGFCEWHNNSCKLHVNFLKSTNLRLIQDLIKYKPNGDLSDVLTNKIPFELNTGIKKINEEVIIDLNKILNFK